MKLLHFNLYWTEGVDLLKKYFINLEGLDLYWKEIRNVDNIWDRGKKNFATQGEAQKKFNLLPADETRWGELTDKVAEPWRDVFEDDLDTTFPRIWI